MSQSKTYSVLFRLQRTVTHYAYVRVPVTDALATAPDRHSLDPAKLIAAAERLGQDPELHWVSESIRISPHPTQTPLPPDYPLRPVVFPAGEAPLTPGGHGS